VDLFIVVSITVSFITIGAGFKYQLDGFSRTLIATKKFRQWTQSDGIRQTKQNSSDSTTSSSLSTSPKSISHNKMRPYAVTLQMALYSVGFGCVYAIAQLNPKGFLLILEFVTSLALNLEGGFFVALMLGYARTGRFRHVAASAEAQLPWYSGSLGGRFLFQMRYLVLGYFSLAIIYDIITIFMHIFLGKFS